MLQPGCDRQLFFRFLLVPRASKREAKIIVSLPPGTVIDNSHLQEMYHLDVLLLFKGASLRSVEMRRFMKAKVDYRCLRLGKTIPSCV